MRFNFCDGDGVVPWRRIWLALLGLSLAVRLALAVLRPDFTFADERWYLDIAQNLRAHGKYECTSLRFAVRQAPGQPFFLAAWGIVFPLTPVSAKAANALVGWGAFVALALALRRRTGSDARTAAFCLLAGFHMPLLFTCSTNYPQALQLLFISLACLAMLRLRDTQTPGQTAGWAWLAGGLTGMGALCVTTQLFMAPSIPAAAWAGRKNWLSAGAMALLGVGMAVAPWAARNLVVEKAFVPLSTSGGELLYMGNNPVAGANTNPLDVLQNRPPAQVEELVACRSGSEVDRTYQGFAKEWIRANPRTALKLWALKTLNYFRWNTGRLATGSGRGSAIEAWVSSLTTLIVYGVFAAGIWAALRRRQWYWPVFSLSWLVVTAAAMGVFVTRYRYRLPVEQAMIWIGCLCLAEARMKTPAGPTK